MLKKIPFQEAVRNASSNRVGIVGPPQSGRSVAGAMWLADRVDEGLECLFLAGQQEVDRAGLLFPSLTDVLSMEPSYVTGAEQVEAVLVDGSGRWFSWINALNLALRTSHVCVYGSTCFMDPGLGLNLEPVFSSRTAIKIIQRGSIDQPSLDSLRAAVQALNERAERFNKGVRDSLANACGAVVLSMESVHGHFELSASPPSPGMERGILVDEDCLLRGFRLETLNGDVLWSAQPPALAIDAGTQLRVRISGQHASMEVVKLGEPVHVIPLDEYS